MSAESERVTGETVEISAGDQQLIYSRIDETGEHTVGVNVDGGPSDE